MTRHDLRLLELVPGQVGYYVTPGGWVPVPIGTTRCLGTLDVSEAACRKCPLAAYSHIMREVYGCINAFEKLCTIPFLRDRKLTLGALMQYRGCGAKDDDYVQAKQLLRIGRRKPL